MITYNISTITLIIGYGGNVIREEVRAKSQYFITDFSQILQSD